MRAKSLAWRAPRKSRGGGALAAWTSRSFWGHLPFSISTRRRVARAISSRSIAQAPDKAHQLLQLLSGPARVYGLGGHFQALDQVRGLVGGVEDSGGIEQDHIPAGALLSLQYIQGQAAGFLNVPPAPGP